MELKINISEEAFELLKEIQKEGSAEYRDSRFETKEDFLKSDTFLNGERTLEWFLSRNFNGSLYLIDELRSYNLVDCNYDAWHMTYVLTDMGKLLIENNK